MRNFVRSTVSLVNGSSGKAGNETAIPDLGPGWEKTETGDRIIFHKIGTQTYYVGDRVTQKFVLMQGSTQPSDQAVVLGDRTFVFRRQKGEIEIRGTQSKRPGTVVTFKGPLTEAVVDQDNRIWVGAPAEGRVVGFDESSKSEVASVDVGRSTDADKLQLSVAGGHAVAVDSTSGEVVPLGWSGKRVSLEGLKRGQTLRTAIEHDSARVPVIVDDTATLKTADLEVGEEVDSLPLDPGGQSVRGADLSAPVGSGPTVFVIDYKRAEVLVVSSRGEWAAHPAQGAAGCPGLRARVPAGLPRLLGQGWLVRSWRSAVGCSRLLRCERTRAEDRQVQGLRPARRRATRYPACCSAAQRGTHDSHGGAAKARCTSQGA